jgi:GxxExxY protein
MTIARWIDNPLANQIVEAAVEVHSVLGGPGLLETVYESALSHELSLRGLHNQRQIPIPVKYKNNEVRTPFFLDLLVENQIILEIKATPNDYPFYQAQLMTHLKFAKISLGLLINFGKKDLRDGLHYITNF